jgi:hypothetical protein
MDAETVADIGRESEVRTGEEQAMERPAVSADELAAVRELALRAYPETVPELVAGASVAELLGSLEGAAAAYRRVAEGIRSRPPALPTVPAGSAPPVALDPERLPPVEKIRRGLEGR